MTFDFYVSDTRTPEPYKEIIHKIYSLMKKVLFFMLTILLALGSWQVSAQTIVEIPSTGGTTGNSYLPSYSF